MCTFTKFLECWTRTSRTKWKRLLSSVQGEDKLCCSRQQWQMRYLYAVRTFTREIILSLNVCFMLLSLLLCTVVFMNSLSVLTGDMLQMWLAMYNFGSRRFFRSSIVASGAKKNAWCCGEKVIPHSSTHFWSVSSKKTKLYTDGDLIAMPVQIH